MNLKVKNILFVNVAQMVLLQHDELERLSNKYKNDLVVIGCPSNQFGQQEPGTHQQILEFCKKNYRMTFLLDRKNKS